MPTLICSVCEEEFSASKHSNSDVCPNCQNKPRLTRTRPATPQSTSSDDWYWSNDGTTTNGPNSLAELEEMQHSGLLRPDALVCHGNSGKWAAISHVVDVAALPPHPSHDLLVTTTDTIERPGLRVAKQLSVINARRVYGINLFLDFLIGMRDFVGGRSATYEQMIATAEAELISDLRLQAFDLGASAIVRFQFQYGEISGKGTQMLLVVASGTPVLLQRIEKQTPTT